MWFMAKFANKNMPDPTLYIGFTPAHQRRTILREEMNALNLWGSCLMADSAKKRSHKITRDLMS